MVSDEEHPERDDPMLLSDDSDQSKTGLSRNSHEASSSSPDDVRSTRISIAIPSSPIELYNPLKPEEYDENQLADFFLEHMPPSFLLFSEDDAESSANESNRGGRNAVSTAAADNLDSRLKLQEPCPMEGVVEPMQHPRRQKPMGHFTWETTNDTTHRQDKSSGVDAMRTEHRPLPKSQ
jgi:hypothetical protein